MVDRDIPIRTSLARVPSGQTTDEEMRRLGKAAWHKPGGLHAVWVCIRLGDIIDDFDRQALTNVANRIYGQRRT